MSDVDAGPVGREPPRRPAPCALFPPGVYRAPRPQPAYLGPQEAPVDTAVPGREPAARAVWAAEPRRADRVHHGPAPVGPDLGGAWPCARRDRGRCALRQRGALARGRFPLPVSGARPEYRLSREVL